MLEAQISGDWFVGNRMARADISTVAGIGFLLYVLTNEWPVGAWPALE